MILALAGGVLAAGLLSASPVQIGMRIDQAFRALGPDAVFAPSCGGFEPRPGIQAVWVWADQPLKLTAVLQQTVVASLHVEVIGSADINTAAECWQRADAFATWLGGQGWRAVPPVVLGFEGPERVRSTRLEAHEGLDGTVRAEFRDAASACRIVAVFAPHTP